MALDNLDNNDAGSQATPTIEIVNSRDYWVKTTSEQPVKPFSGVTLTDANADAIETVTITVGEGGDTGTLTGEGLSGGEGGVYTLKGSAADVTAKLQQLVFTPVEGKPLYTTFTYFTLTAQNSAGDPPVIAEVAGVQNADPAVTIKGAVANQFTESAAPINPFSSVKITDAVPGKTETLTITLSDGAGGFGGTLDGGGSAVVADAQFRGGDGVYTLSGSASVVTAALKALIFTPSKGQPNTITTTTFTLSDKNSDTASPVINNKTTVSNIDPPVAPTITTPKQSLVAISDEGVKPFANVILTDNNADATEFLTIVVTGVAGTLSGDGLRFIGNATYALMGSAAEVESQLKNLTFTPDGKDQGEARFLLNATSIIDEQAIATSDEITVTVMGVDMDMAMSVGDFNNDGKQDIAITNFADHTVSILLGNGDGFFKDKVSYETGQGPVAISVGDFNYDGKLDLVVANARENTASILLGKGDGTFQPQTRYATGGLPFSASVADVDNDGVQDLIVANHSGDNTISVLLGNGDGTFKSQVTYATGNGATGVAAGDFNNDGKLDIVVGNYGNNTLSVLLGNGDGTFRPQTTYATGSGPKGVAAGDFNNDGKLDIVVGNYGDNTLSVLLGKGDGTFQPQMTYETGKNPASFSLADFDADGDLDIVVQNYGDNTISVMTGNGDGTFQPQETIPLDFPLGPLVISDVNGDGQPDIVVSNLQNKTIADFFNTTHAVPTISGAIASQSTDAKTLITPFAGVTITDDNEGATEKVKITMSGGGGTLAGEGLTDNDGGIYTLTGSAVEVAKLLQALTFKPDGKDPGDVTTIRLVSISLVRGVEVSYSAPVTVAVTELAPPVITSASVADVAENVATSVAVYQATGTDADSGPNLLWSLSGGADKDKFVIDPSTGKVTFVDSPNFEAPADSGGDNVYDIVVRASDGSLYVDKALAITVTDVVEKAPSVPPPVAFATPKTYATGGAPGTVAIGDVNGDKNPDMVTANYIDNTVSVLLADGDGGYKEKVDYQAGAGPVKVSLGDFNGDGEQDIVVTNTMDDTVSILLGKGDGTFQAQSAFDTGDYPQWVSVADLDKDGIADLIVANFHSSNSISVLLGNAGGTFRRLVTYETGPSAVSLTTGDFNRDNKLDIVVSNFGDNTLSILQGNGDGTFQTQRAFGTGAGPQSIIAVDVNHDDKLDLVVQSYYGDSVCVHLGNGDGTFGAQTAYKVGRTPGEISVADLNGDGHSDIVAPNYGDGTVSILLGNGDGTFETQQVYKVGNGANSVAIQDLNGDGQFDLVVTNHQDDIVSVLLNETVKSPVVASISRARNDFDGDHRSDILLQNGADGSCYVWEMNGLSFKPEGVGFVGWTPPTNQWRAVGTGDFDRDGKSDILLQNGADGSCYVWQMDGLSFKPEGVGYVGWTPPTNQWRAVGTGDFDGDGRSDILLQDGDTGDCFVWAMNGLSVKESGYVGWRPPSKEWRAVGTGDFDGDGRSDILLQDGATGDCFVWEMNGLSVKESGYVGWRPPSNEWRAVGTGDFDGDGKSDILLQDGDTGDCFVWEMNGLTVKDKGAGYVGWRPPSNEWRAVGTDDYNGDGRSDILLQDGTTGDCFVWEMKGLELLNETSFGYVGWRPPSADWHATA